MAKLKTSPLDFDLSSPMAGLQRIRLAYSNDIFQQKWQTDTEIPTPILFDTEDAEENWIADWSNGDFVSAEYGIQENVSDGGNAEIYTLKVAFLSGINQIDFKAWFDKYLRKQKLCVVINDNNCNERAFNPFEVTYKYILPSNESEPTRYELSFQRVRLVQPPADDYILGVLMACGENMASYIQFDFLSNKGQLYDIGYSAINNIDTVAEWKSGNEIFTNVPDGKYYGFAKIKNIDFDIVLTCEFTIDCYVCKFKFSHWEEFFECQLSFTDWEEITEIAVSEATLILGTNI